MESNDSPEIPDRGETSDIPGLPLGDKIKFRENVFLNQKINNNVQIFGVYHFNKQVNTQNTAVKMIMRKIKCFCFVFLTYPVFWKKYPYDGERAMEHENSEKNML